MWLTLLIAFADISATDLTSRTGWLCGTVVWAGPPPKFANAGCEVHDYEIQGHDEVTGGLADAVVVAEPLDPATQKWFHAHPANGVDVDWSGPPGARVAVVAPGAWSEGIHHALVDGVAGWLYVTPYPASVSGGNCRFVFEVPRGRYRLHGWHPKAGERARVVDVPVVIRGHEVSPMWLLMFGNRSL
jgi:hypothetical protein